MTKTKPTFSQRMGRTPMRSELQLESMDDDLRNGIWSVLTKYIWSSFRPPLWTQEIADSNMEDFVGRMFLDFLKTPVDEAPSDFRDFLRILRGLYFDWEWHRVYDFIEFVASYWNEDDYGSLMASSGLKRMKLFMSECNRILERENSAYRFVGCQVTQITSEEELGAIDDALAACDKFAGARAHLKTAIALMSDRKTPDYRNSVKESISAVESVAISISGNKKATLGDALKEIEKSGNLHPALKGGFDKIYGYTSDGDGIRHAMLDDGKTITFTDAKFMLVACSAFVNYLIGKLADQQTPGS